MEEPIESTKKIILKDPPKKRIITSSKGWCFDEKIISLDKQLDLIKQLISSPDNMEPSLKTMIQKQICDKIAGYKAQDIKKKLYNAELFVDFEKVLTLMIDSENICFYCKNLVHVLYENAREPRQWTLERIDNKEGHNKNNVMMACLECNLRRGTMYHERFLFTKQLRIEKK